MPAELVSPCPDELAAAKGVVREPAVVIPLTTVSWMMLQRNPLYTGVTRATKLVVPGRAWAALAAAVRAKGAGRRHTVLAHRLRAGT